MMADGNPAHIRHINQIGLERAGTAPEAMRAIKDAFRILYRSDLNTAQALERMQTELGAWPEIQQVVEFVSASKRGITR